MSKHAPGPWLIEPKDTTTRGHWLRDSGGVYVALACSIDGDRPQEDANAHLIAAAPDMYEELRQCSIMLGLLRDNAPHLGLILEPLDARIKRIADVRAKAEGRS